MVILALLSACALAVALAIAHPALAQQTPDNGSKDAGGVPISFILDSAIDAHEQDIRDKMFEYKFEAAAGNPAGQVALVEERSNELKNDTAHKKSILKALMAKNGSVSGNKLAKMADELGASIDKLSGQSKKLEEYAAGLTLLYGSEAYTGPIEPLISEVNDARGLAQKASRAAKDNNNGNSGNNGNNNGKQNDNAKPKK